VVATGFDADPLREGTPAAFKNNVSGLSTMAPSHAATPAPVSPRVASAPVAPVVEPEREEVQPEPSVAYPVRKISEPDMIIEEKVQPRMIHMDEETSDLEEDADLEIPAFIRRKMKK